MKRRISVLLLVLLLLTAGMVQVASQDAPWWMNRTIKGFEFDGLEHVLQEQLQPIVEEYSGKQLNNEMLQLIQNDLYDLEYFSYFYASARRSQEPENQVILVFAFVELPLVTSLSLEGNSVLSNQRIREIIQVSQGSFFNRSKFRADPDLIRKEYLSRGYADVTIQESFSLDEAENTVSVSYEIEEGLQSRIDSIAFEGNENFSDNTLKRQLSSKEQSLFNRGIFVESQIDEDRESVLNFYRNRGYIDAEITNVVIERVETERSRVALSITFIMDEGPFWTFGGISISGNTLFSDEELKANTRLRPGDTLNIGRLQEDISRIVEVYYDSGYIYNDVDPREIRNEEDNSISFELIVYERGQAFIETINISGNQRTRDYVITREITLQPGEVFSRADLVQSMRNLYNTGLFDLVDVDPRYGTEEGLIDLDVEVSEANRIDLRFGATFGGGQEFPISGFLSWNDKNFFGTGSDFSIAVEASPTKQSLDFTYMENWLFGRRWSGGINLRFDRTQISNVLQDRGHGAPYPYHSYDEYQAAGGSSSIDAEYLMDYLEYKIGLGFSTGYTFHTDYGRFNIGGGYSYARSMITYDSQQFRPYDPSIRDNHDQWLFNNTIFLTTTWDRRDLIYNPTSGFMLHNRLTVSGGILNEPMSFIDKPQPTNYIKNQSRIAGYLTLIDRPRTDRDNQLWVLSGESSFSFLFPQKQSAAQGFALQQHLLYIDGMNTARGWGFKSNLEVLWDNKIKVTTPLVRNVLDAEFYTSATWGYEPDDKGTGLLTIGEELSFDNFKFSAGAGIKLGIQGLPLGLFLTKAFQFEEGGKVNWMPDGVNQNLFGDLGLQLVFTIDYSLF